MKKNDLKKILKPLIKECIKECILEEGVLSGVITEVAKGLTNQRVVVEGVTISKEDSKEKALQRKAEELERQRQERIKKLNQSTPYGEMNIFEGTKEIIGESQGTGGALAGVSPDDAGVDIGGIMNLAAGKWKQLI